MRIPYDEAGKELCEGSGDVVIQREVRGEPQWVDVHFEPRAGARLGPLGLLGRIADGGCLLELFHDPPGTEEVRACLCKQLVLHRERRKTGVAHPIVPLWLVSAGRPDRVLADFELRPRDGWPSGVYQSAVGYAWNIVVVSELPVEGETLLVRLLGAGKTLRRAVADLRGLSPHSLEARVGERALRVLRSAGVVPRDSNEEAIIMEIRETHDEWLQRAKDEGRNELLAQLFERKLARPLGAGERSQLWARVGELGSKRVLDVSMDLDAEALAAWLADPSAR